jgi:hypothetical protein
MNNWRIIGFSRISLLGILVFKGLNTRRLYKSFGVKGLIMQLTLRHWPAVIPLYVSSAYSTP